MDLRLVIFSLICLMSFRLFAQNSYEQLVCKADSLFALSENNHAQCLILYEQAREIYPDKGKEAYIGMGNVYRELGEFQKAFEAFEKAISIDKKNFWVYHCQGLLYYDMEEYLKAIKQFNKAIRFEAIQDDYYWRGMCYYNLGNYRYAISDFNYALNFNDMLHELALYYKGRSQLKLGNTEDAIKCFNELCEQSNTSFRGPYGLGLAFHALGRFEDALKAFDRSILLQPGDSDDYFRKGNVYMDMEDYLNAEEQYSKAIEISPEVHYFYSSRAVAREKLGKEKEAKNDREKSNALSKME